MCCPRKLRRKYQPQLRFKQSQVSIRSVYRTKIIAIKFSLPKNSLNKRNFEFGCKLNSFFLECHEFVLYFSVAHDTTLLLIERTDGHTTAQTKLLRTNFYIANQLHFIYASILLHTSKCLYEKNQFVSSKVCRILYAN